MHKLVKLLSLSLLLFSSFPLSSVFAVKNSTPPSPLTDAQMIPSFRPGIDDMDIFESFVSNGAKVISLSALGAEHDDETDTKSDEEIPTLTFGDEKTDEEILERVKKFQDAEEGGSVIVDIELANFQDASNLFYYSLPYLVKEYTKSTQELTREVIKAYEDKISLYKPIAVRFKSLSAIAPEEIVMFGELAKALSSKYDIILQVPIENKEISTDWTLFLKEMVTKRVPITAVQIEPRKVELDARKIDTEKEKGKGISKKKAEQIVLGQELVSIFETFHSKINTNFRFATKASTNITFGVSFYFDRSLNALDTKIEEVAFEKLASSLEKNDAKLAFMDTFVSSSPSKELEDNNYGLYSGLFPGVVETDTE